jgi:hypothetical protein
VRYDLANSPAPSCPLNPLGIAMTKGTPSHLEVRIAQLESRLEGLYVRYRRVRSMFFAILLAALIIPTISMRYGQERHQDIQAGTLTCERIVVTSPKASPIQDVSDLASGATASTVDTTTIVPGKIDLSSSDRRSMTYNGGRIDFLNTLHRTEIAYYGLRTKVLGADGATDLAGSYIHPSGATFRDGRFEGVGHGGTTIKSSGINIGLPSTSEQLSNYSKKATGRVSLDADGIKISDGDYNHMLILGEQSTVEGGGKRTVHPAHTISGWRADGKLMYILPR